ncbi:Protein CMSS1 [Euphorbia peplus]|nr:Protein CMSS1 [Euphorbia peplus]
MASGKAAAAKPQKDKNPKKLPNFKHKKAPPTEQKKKKKKEIDQIQNEDSNSIIETEDNPKCSASQQLNFFLNNFLSPNGIKLSSLELQSFTESRFLGLSKELGHDVESLGKQIKAAFGSKWKQELCEGQGKVDAGCPAVLILSTSAIRAIELLRGVRSFTKECHAVKLFSKHMKVEEQVALLKARVNFGSGTPSRVKKLIDIEALGLSRLALVVLDIHTDVKGYSLLTLPQVSDEFLDLYKNYFHPRILEGHLRVCLFGPLPDGKSMLRGKKRKVIEE